MKDAFASDSPAVSLSTWRPVDDEISSDRAHPEENGATNIVSAPYQAEIRNFPSVPLPPLPLPSSSLAQIMNDDHEIDLVQVPRLTKRPRMDYLSYPDVNQAIIDNVEEEDDLSEGECEAHMRQIRRSLSLERRFEKVAEEERPRLLKRDEGENTNTSNALAEQDNINQHHAHNNYSGRNGEAFAGINELRRDGFSFTATADAWDRCVLFPLLFSFSFPLKRCLEKPVGLESSLYKLTHLHFKCSIRDRFHLNDTRPQQHDHIVNGWGGIPASSSSAPPEQRASRRPRQMMTLEELPPS